MEPASTAVLTWGTVKMIGYFVGATVAVCGFGYGVHYLARSNKKGLEIEKSARKDLAKNLEEEKKARVEADEKLHQRIDRKQEKFESCVRRIEAKQDESNKLLHMLCGKFGVLENQEKEAGK